MAACLLLLLVVVATVVSPADAQCSNMTVNITSDPRSSIIKEETTFTCTLSRECVITNVTWYFENITVVFQDHYNYDNDWTDDDYKDRASAEKIGGSMTLKLNKTLQKDAGWWRCNIATEECPQGVGNKIYQEVKPDTGGGGLDGWEIALIVIGVLVAVFVPVGIICKMRQNSN